MSYAIEMLNITKDFPGIRANDDVTLQVEEKSIHALLGAVSYTHLDVYKRQGLCWHRKTRTSC